MGIDSILGRFKEMQVEARRQPCLVASLLDTFFPADAVEQQPKSERVKTLENFVGRQVRVSHIDLGVSKVEYGTVRDCINNEVFYLQQGSGYHQVCWDRAPDHCVKSIECEGIVIYDNPAVELGPKPLYLGRH